MQQEVKINLNSRLQTVLSLVPKNSVVCDVGTDHGHLACNLISGKIAKKVIASDVNISPLNNAKKNVDLLNYNDKIQLVLSDGLKQVTNDMVNCVCIAGMGSELIIDILLGVDWVKDVNISFILQPMSNVEYLRKNLYSNGFFIKDEIVVLEKNHLYTVLSVCYNGVKSTKNEYFSFVGLVPIINNNNKDAHNILLYLNKVYKKIERIQNGLKKAKNISNENRFNELEWIKREVFNTIEKFS